MRGDLISYIDAWLRWEAEKSEEAKAALLDAAGKLTQYEAESKFPLFPYDGVVFATQEAVK